MRFPLPKLADDCLLFFWRVATMVKEAHAVIDAWGFTPTGGELKWVKTTGPCALVLDPEADLSTLEAFRKSLSVAQVPQFDALVGKLFFGMGRTLRNCDEVCIIARRGKLKVASQSERSVFFAPVGEHSAKPDRFYEIVERLAPSGPYVELFARRPRDNWLTYGDELPEAHP